jgi:beta-lactamase superfamily II metal-dependent hydrolase
VILRSRTLCALFVGVFLADPGFGQKVGEMLPAWSRGFLDIHQIQTGRGNAALLIFPDGTTMLIDAGGVPDRPGPELGPQRPNSSRSPGEWIARYIQHFSPGKTLDYALITHYHDDHMGAIASVGQLVPIRMLLDRGDNPPPVSSSLLDGYRKFRANFGGTAQRFEPGRADQVVARHESKLYPTFEVRNVAANGEVWTGAGTSTAQVFPAGWDRLPKDEQPTENDFSIALRIRYGPFRYFTGGDQPGVLLDNLPSWHDLETPVAGVVGPVDVLVLNHHGWLDTTNTFFLQTLRPRVVVIPAWHATHPDHGVLRRLLSTRIYPGPRDLFTTTLLEAPRTIFSYLGQPFKSTEGHIVIRVAPGGRTYSVLILDDRDESYRVTGIAGPYTVTVSPNE